MTTLPRAWAARCSEAPDRPVLWEERRGWVTAGDLDRASRRIAARFAGAGLRPGDRILLSAGTSVDLVEAHVAALRLGLVVVPANTAYREREIAHLVGDATPRAALVDDPERARWIQRAAPATLVVGPDVGLPDTGPAPRPRRRRPRRSGHSRLHVGHHRIAQGRRPVPRQPPGLLGVRPDRLAVDRR